MKETKHLTEKEKYRQCNKEALISLAIFTGYAIWWYLTGFGLWEKGVDVWICGLPLWFVLSCIVGWVLCVVAVTLVVKFCFKNFDLGEEADSGTSPRETGKEA